MNRKNQAKRSLPLNALRAFEAVSRHLHVGTAAQELNVTPSAVSHLIKRLEDDIGVKLVKKSGRNIALTPAAEKMSPELQEIFGNLKRVVGVARTATGKDRLTVSVRPYFSVKWLAPRLNKFWNAYPAVELRLHHSIQQVDFRAEQVDLAIEWSRGDRPGVEHHLLIPGELTPVFSPKMDDADKISSPADLLKYALLKETDHDSWADWFAFAGLEQAYSSIAQFPKTHFIDDSNVRHQAALDGLGVELSSRRLLKQEISEGVLLAPFELSLNSFSYYLVAPKNEESSILATCFKRWILSEVE
jgi:LysR family glycine cleavage system transcriptional activator